MENWKITYENWLPAQESLREALCTLGNGYFATRGAAEESAAGNVHYPGTYLAGGYNRLQSKIAGKIIENEDLVNWPNWLPLTFRHPNENWFDLAQVSIVYFKQELDLKTGLLLRQLRFRDKNGRETSLKTTRLVSMAQPHLAAMEWELTPENWSGPIEIRSALDGSVRNAGVARYQALNNQHLKITETGEEKDSSVIFLAAQTNQSKIRMAQAARTRFYSELPAEWPVSTLVQQENYVAHQWTLSCEKQKTIRIEKVVALYTSRDMAITEPLFEARKTLEQSPTFSELLEAHRLAWQQLWQRCDLVVATNDRTQQILRLHIFHLLQTVSLHTADLDVGIPARGWHGEAYRGHIFWDELFIFSFLNLRLPELARELLMYRYRRLPGARAAARQAGYRGAMFPWQSGSNGREESQVIHLNPKSGNWLPDDTYLQRHINAAVAYNVWHYFQTTGNIEFLNLYGAEMIFEIALFWASLASWNEEKQRFEIKGVVGPDEYHTRYPDSEEPGLNNNAYTNIMAVWVLETSLQLPGIIGAQRQTELYEKLKISNAELERWDQISRKMFIPFIDGSQQVISQFEGYEKLEDLDICKYRETGGEMLRLDRILEKEGLDINRFKASKQADVLMLFYLFSTEKLIGIFDRLGYDFKPEHIPANIAYYEQRTTHGSTLSKIVYSWVLARADRKRSWSNFQTALLSDIDDLQGGTTSEGIHLGAMSGSVDLVQRCFTGLELLNNELLLNPVLPDNIYYLELRLKYLGHWLSLRLTQQKLIIAPDPDWTNDITINIRGNLYKLKAGEVKEINLNH
ncbi:glycoside hydrolase family 65 protein [Adhaeribacter sp. BT258]|uniref:Glycoside hydrolase family 65 protein n=1 Tax=Adhaeribacter terrigena TaxID=2793070 RepID=A0ABS1C2G5_9BACT|nr:glycoside hydrolase family 65 protein [Adhaeribacter terrigena]MBK0403357.1 glycoside hydrolase family 65 protein [Adhaeribacter terrigena]